MFTFERSGEQYLIEIEENEVLGKDRKEEGMDSGWVNGSHLEDLSHYHMSFCL